MGIEEPCLEISLFSSGSYSVSMKIHCADIVDTYTETIAKRRKRNGKERCS